MTVALIVVAHPDDEVLGCGATAALLASQGIQVRSCILSGRAVARRNRPDDPILRSDTERAQAILGLGAPFLGDFPNIEFNTVPHLRMVQFIESAVVGCGADVLFTHHPADLNNDHLHTSQACQAAARLFQRRADVPRLKALYFMEILSATDWSFASSGQAFRADTFVEVGEHFLQKKLEALAAYGGVMRDFPHSRSTDVLRGLAACRGGQAGQKYSEAFQTAFFALDAGRIGH
jgi:LmbE family N-acetylglucosaminyl deacetylase